MFKVFENCQVGDILSGRIVNIKSIQNNIYIVNISGELFSAYSEIGFKVGEKVDLEILSIQSPLSFKLLKAGVLKQGSREKVRMVNLLNSCMIEVNDNNIKKIEDYINAGNPVQLDLILKLFKN